MTDFVLQISDWYRLNKRDLPWRRSKNPYFIWLSEVILQQTRVDQGTPYYLRFSENFKTVTELALASEDEILKLWQGLGYYSRARNLHTTAKIIHEKYEGVFPNNYDGLIQLKGIGPYTAAAIASIAYNEPKAVVDGNVYRVLSRYFGIETPIDTAVGKKEFQALADEILPPSDAGNFNQAIMEFGALHCTPKQANCSTCPVQASCRAYLANSVDKLPIKQGKTKVRDRYFHYFHMESNGEIALTQRSDSDIWQKLYEFPMIESSNSELPEDALNLVNEPKLVFNTKHILSHQRIHAYFYIAEPKQKASYNRVERVRFEDFPIHRLMEKYWENYGHKVGTGDN